MFNLMKQHGRTILYCAAAVLVLGIAFHIRSGLNTGFIQIAYAKARQSMSNMDVMAYTDTSAVKAFAARSKPKITYSYTKALPKSEINLNQMFSAVDADGTSVAVEITDILNSRGESILYQTEEERKQHIMQYHTDKFLFPSVGIYTINVKATDTEKKTVYGKYRLPVTSN